MTADTCQSPGVRRRVFVPGYTGHVSGVLTHDYSGTFASDTRQAHWDLHHQQNLDELPGAGITSPDKYYPKHPNARRKTNVCNHSNFTMGDDRERNWTTTSGAHFKIPTKIPPRHQSIIPCSSGSREELHRAYTEATIKAGQGAVEKMQEDIRAKVFQKTTATNGPLMLRKAFKFFDNDKSGGIDPDEFHAAMSNFGLQFTAEQILCLFNTFDKNRDGEISYTEFVEEVMLVSLKGQAYDSSLQVRKVPVVAKEAPQPKAAKSALYGSDAPTLEDLQVQFNRFDPNNTGEVDLRELHRLVENCGLALGHEQVNSAMCDLDDGSGNLTFDHFVEWWSQQKVKSPIAASRSKQEVPRGLTHSEEFDDEVADINFDVEEPPSQQLHANAAGEMANASRARGHLAAHAYRSQSARPRSAASSRSRPSSAFNRKPPALPKKSAANPFSITGNQAQLNSRGRSASKHGGWVKEPPTTNPARPNPNAQRPSSAASSRCSSQLGVPGVYYARNPSPIGTNYVLPDRVEYTGSGLYSNSRPASAPGYRAKGQQNVEKRCVIGNSMFKEGEATGFRL